MSCITAKIWRAGAALFFLSIYEPATAQNNALAIGPLGAFGSGVSVTPPMAAAIGPIRVSPKEALIQKLFTLPLDSFYLFAAPSSQEALTDLIVPSRIATISGSPTFTPNKGFTGDGVSAFIDTKYNPATNAVNLSQNSNAAGVFALNIVSAVGGAWDYGQSTLSVNPLSSTSTATFSRNASSSSDQIALQGTAANLFTSTRNASGGFNLFRSAAQIFSESASSAGANIYTAGSEQQGWATDGSNYYTTQTGASSLVKRDLTWAPVLTNSSPFTGLDGSGLNHIGASDVANGKIYSPVGKWSGSCGGANANNQIAVYETTGLTLQQKSGILSLGTGSLAALAVDTVRNVIYGVNFCDPTVIYIFDLASLAQTGSIPISVGASLGGFQGVAYYNNNIFISALNGTTTQILMLDMSGALVAIIHPVGVSGYEGINVSSGTLGVMGDNQSTTAVVNFYAIPTLGTTQSFARTSGAFASATMTVFKINGGAAFTHDQIAAVFAGGGMTAAQIAGLNQALQSYLHAVGAN